MTITPEQVTDLQPGDVVELSWPSTSDDRVTLTARGALRSISGETAALFLGAYCVRDQMRRPIYGDRRSLTVVSRAPRPLYVNHPRTDVWPGDVVRDAERAGPTVWMADRNGGWWLASMGTVRLKERHDLPARLILLVDGATGQVVR